MTKVYIALNGDDVGYKIGQHIAADDHKGLQASSDALRQSHDMLDNWVTSKGGKIVSTSGDEGIYIIPEEALGDLEYIRNDYKNMSGHALTVGVGSSMSEASKALIYGKLNGKNQIVEYEPQIDSHISEEESADPEEQEKQAEMAEATGEEVGSKHPEEPEHEEDMSPEEEVIHDAAEQEEDERDPDFLEADEEYGEEGIDGKPSEEEIGIGEAEPEKEVGIPEEGMINEDNNNEIEEPTNEGIPEEENPAEIEEEMAGEMPPEKPPENENKSPYDGTAPETEDPADNEEEEMVDDYDHNDALADMIHGHMEEDGEGDFEPENEMPEEEGGSDDELRSDIASALAIFKQNRGALEEARSANPELYEAMITMLSSMVEMAKKQGYAPEEDADSMELQAQMPEEEPMEQEGEKEPEVEMEGENEVPPRNEEKEEEKEVKEEEEGDEKKEEMPFEKKKK